MTVTVVSRCFSIHCRLNLAASPSYPFFCNRVDWPVAFQVSRQNLPMRIQEALAELESLGLCHHIDARGIWVESSTRAFLFDTAVLSKAKVRRFNYWYRWYLGHSNKALALEKLPPGVRTIKKIRRDWNDIKPLAPVYPIKPSTSGSASGSDSTVPGHLTQLNIYDLRRRG
jgi:hypothetical protein